MRAPQGVDAVASDVALRQVAFAAWLNKRFAPVVCHRVASVQAVRRVNAEQASKRTMCRPDCHIGGLADAITPAAVLNQAPNATACWQRVAAHRGQTESNERSLTDSISYRPIRHRA
jgi:hypothetical protein